MTVNAHTLTDGHDLSTRRFLASRSVRLTEAGAATRIRSRDVHRRKRGPHATPMHFLHMPHDMNRGKPPQSGPLHNGGRFETATSVTCAPHDERADVRPYSGSVA